MEHLENEEVLLNPVNEPALPVEEMQQPEQHVEPEPLPVQPLYWSITPATYFRRGDDEPTAANVIVAQIEPCWSVLLIKDGNGVVMYEKQLSDMVDPFYRAATIHQELAADRHVLQWRIIDSDGEQNYELVFTSADAVEAFLEASRMMAQKATEYHLRMNSALRHVHELLDNLIAYG